MRLGTREVLVACTAAVAALSASAGDVNVALVNPAGFADAGTTFRDRELNLRALTEHLQTLGKRHLPADRLLKVELLDVDLAGIVRPSRRAGPELRIVKGAADWPRMSLRYTLESNGKAVASGEESLADMNYRFGATRVHSSDPLYYEKRMLDEWFKARFVDARAAGG